MALADADTYQRVSVTHEFEDIRDVIYDVSPTETPFVTNANQIAEVEPKKR